MSSSTLPATRRVLVLEDNPTLLRIIGSMLARNGCEVALCQEIEAAETLLSRQKYAVLVTDLNVSALGGAEGIRLARFSKTHFPECRVVILSGHITEVVRAMADEIGTTAVLDKPVSEELLVKAVLGNDGLSARRTPGSAHDVPLVQDLLNQRALSAKLQPIVFLQSMDVACPVFAVEGLARGPSQTILARPDLFLEYASRKGQGVEADLQCIDAVLREANRLQPDVPIFLNIQPRSLTTADFAIRLLELLADHGVPVTRTVLEITEHETIVNPTAFGRTLAALRAKGFRFALDDYGEGVSNLLLLQSLEPEFIKVSSRLTDTLASSRWSREMLRSTTGLAEKLGIDLVVEGIETADQARVARDMGVRYAQGYHFARPSSMDELERSQTVRFAEVRAS